MVRGLVRSLRLVRLKGPRGLAEVIIGNPPRTIRRIPRECDRLLQGDCGSGFEIHATTVRLAYLNPAVSHERIKEEEPRMTRIRVPARREAGSPRP